MVLNPRTLHVSPQYHIVFDDNFSTVKSMVNGEIPDTWVQLVRQSEEVRDENGNELARLWASKEYNPFFAEDTNDTHDSISENDTPTTPRTNNISTKDLYMPKIADIDELTCRRSTRIRKEPERLSMTVKKNSKSRYMGLFSMICMVTVDMLLNSTFRSSLFAKVVYQTQ